MIFEAKVLYRPMDSFVDYTILLIEMFGLKKVSPFLTHLMDLFYAIYNYT